MLFIPAIDLKSGECVRLRQGDIQQVTVFSNDPGAMARYWLEQGALRLHVVDLDGAFAGVPSNDSAVHQIINQLDGQIPIQLGGGIRDLLTIERAINSGIQYVMLGTVAVNNPDLLREACRQFPGRIMVGLDARDGFVAVNGWSKQTHKPAAELLKSYEQDGVVAVVYTDISRDGMLAGVNVLATKSLAQQTKIPVFASGGVATLDDIDQLCLASEYGVAGAIVGRALYDGTLDLSRIQERVQIFRARCSE